MQMFLLRTNLQLNSYWINKRKDVLKNSADFYNLLIGAKRLERKSTGNIKKTKRKNCH